MRKEVHEKKLLKYRFLRLIKKPYLVPSLRRDLDTYIPELNQKTRLHITEHISSSIDIDSDIKTILHQKLKFLIK